MTHRIGLIGAATITRDWMCEAFRRHPDAQVVAVLGSDADRTRSFAVDLDIPAWEVDIDRFLSKHGLDAVYIASTNDKHCQQTLAALAAGKHVLCEKPLGVTDTEVVQMVEAAEAAGLVLATNHHLRHHASHRAIRDIVQSGVLGDIMLGRVSFTALLPDALARWRMQDPKTGAGVVLDLTVHDIDCLRFWFQQDPLRVSGIGQARRGNGILDNVTTTWEFPNGAVVTCQDSFNVPHGGTAVELHGRQASLLAVDVMGQQAGGTLRLTDKNGPRDVPLDSNNAYDGVVADFLAATLGQGVPGCSGRDGLAALRYALAAQEAILSGRRIEISSH